MPYGRGILPFTPFEKALPLPTVDPFSAPLCSVTLNRSWFPYIAGACLLLVVASSWEASDPTTLQQVLAWAESVQGYLATPDLAINLVFQKKPGRPTMWQYSVDGGTTWVDGPDNDIFFIPSFIPDGGALSGYDLSVNAGLSSEAIPLLTAEDPDAVVTDPISSLVNDIAPGLDINALKLIAQGNATPLQLVNQGIAVGNLLLMIAAL